MNQISDIIKEPDPPILVQLDNDACIHCNPLYLLEDNNSTVLLKRVAYYLGGSIMGRQVKLMIQLISSMLTTVNFIPKEMHVSLFSYLSLK